MNVSHSSDYFNGRRDKIQVVIWVVYIKLNSNDLFSWHTWQQWKYLLSEDPLYFPVDSTVAEWSAKYKASWFMSAGDGVSRTEGFSNGCWRCMVSLENVGQNLFFQTHAIRIIIKAEFFLPLLVTAERVVESSCLAGIWPFSFASDTDTSLACVSGCCHYLMILGKTAKVSQSSTCIEIYLQICWI